MTVKWELLKERSGLINHHNLHAAAESPQCFLLKADCEFSSKWQESWVGKEHLPIRGGKETTQSSRKDSHCYFCYHTMRDQSSQLQTVCCHKHDFSVIGAVSIFQSTLCTGTILFQKVHPTQVYFLHQPSACWALAAAHSPAELTWDCRLGCETCPFYNNTPTELKRDSLLPPL